MCKKIIAPYIIYYFAHHHQAQGYTRTSAARLRMHMNANEHVVCMQEFPDRIALSEYVNASKPSQRYGLLDSVIKILSLIQKKVQYLNPKKKQSTKFLDKNSLHVFLSRNSNSKTVSFFRNYFSIRTGKNTEIVQEKVQNFVI